MAVDGVIEISQAGTESAGGFPFAISNSGSYRLTSNLTVTTDGVNAINVAGDNLRFVTIDLNGFTIRGTGSGSGQGISAFAVGLTVRNGTVENFGGVGISAGAQLVAEDLTVSNNGGRGIAAGGPSTLRGITVRENGGDGALISSGLVTGSVFSGNAGAGLNFASGTGALLGGYSNNVFILNTGGAVSSGLNLGGNMCGDAICP
jgi:hypothetical protein